MSSPDPLAHEALDRTFEAILFDWDGTAVPDREADASGARERIDALCRADVHVFVISGTHVGNVDGQLQARPPPPGRLHLCLNRGSEVFEVGPDGPRIVWRREATDDEDAALDRAADLAVAALAERGIVAEIVSQRLNRRKIDVIPEPRWADPPKAQIDQLLEAVTARLAAAGFEGLTEVVALAEDAARRAGLADPRISSDVKHVEIGLTDKTDSAHWAASWLAERGITGSLILVAGDELGPIGDVPGSDSLMIVPALARAPVVSVGVEPGGVPPGVLHLGGGPARFLDLLDAQLRRRSERRVPWIDEDPAWVVPLPEGPTRERAAEAMGTLANGRAGARGSREEDGPGTTPLFVVNGVYTPDGASELLPGPAWTSLAVQAGHGGRRLLDLRTGVLARRGERAPDLRSVRFVSAARPEAMGLRAEAAPSSLPAEATVADQAGDSGVEGALLGRLEVAATGADAGAGIVVASRDWLGPSRDLTVVERLAAWAASPDRPPDRQEAARSCEQLAELGFDRLVAEHRGAWARLWSDAVVTIEGDPDAELATRFALFHVLSSVPDAGEAAVGARGLSGPAYGGHVFWDADVHVLPVLAAVRPAAARAMLEYRIRRLPAARAAAVAGHRRGARFPWESGRDGTDVTPDEVQGALGQVIPIRTGDLEEHIVADVAWAASEYAAWTGDAAFLAGPGRDLLLDTARYWASRVEVDAGGRAHVLGVIGPDEYHEAVDDNAFTNVMARWNLRRAAALTDATGGDAGEAASWRQLADVVVDGWDPGRSLYEQFAGYWDLEPLLVASIARPPIAADVLLGRERVAGSQIIKQADVLMLHHLVPDQVVPGSLAANLDFYGPRTAHGSSLSPAIHAALLARAGRPDEGLELYRLAARLDLDDVTGTTAGGVHLATMGGVWQALAYGFLGLRPGPDGLAVDPCLPTAWEAVSVRLRFGGRAVTLHADHHDVVIACTEPVTVRVRGQAPEVCTPPGRSWTLPPRPPEETRSHP